MGDHRHGRGTHRRLAQAHDRNAPASQDPEVRHFRARLDAQWGLERTAEDLQRRLTQLEDAIRTTSALHTQGLMQVLSVYGLPFVVSGGITSQLAPLLDVAANTLSRGVAGASLFKFGVYLGLAAVLIALMRLVQHRWLKGATRPVEGTVKRSLQDTSTSMQSNKK